ncbi:MAG: ASKHA domain-containing protein [Promethearchaeota archaeon]
MKKKIILDFEPISRRLIITESTSIYKLLQETGIHIKALCGGKGSCGKCRILAEKGGEFLNLPSDLERDKLAKDELNDGWRLACQCKINEEQLGTSAIIDDLNIRIFLPDDLLLEDFKILTSGIKKGVVLNPAVKKYFLNVEKPSLKNPVSDFERILSTFKSKTGLNLFLNNNLAFLQKLSRILRENDHQITLSVWNDDRIIDCEPGNVVSNNFGIAFDIGTTTIVGYLINLNNGRIYAVASRLNPQTAYGEDVVSRINFVKENENGLFTLKSAVNKALNAIIQETCTVAQIHYTQIKEVSVVGNSVMHHIFLGLDPLTIGLSPYVPTIRKEINVMPKDLNLNANPFGNIYVAPLIAGFVGADTMGVIISSEIEKEEELTLVIDIGTNGEIIVGNAGSLSTASCAAGSALEGAHISSGMRAAGGAIDTVKINPKTLELTYTTINKKPPIGICGSGLIDLVAELLKTKILTRSGNFNKEFIDSPFFLKNEKVFEFIVVDKAETDFKRAITLSQDDIRQIQMAKGAFYSGTKIILNHLNQNKMDFTPKIKQVFLAGAFGNYINKENARFIGMIPDIPREHIYQIGNAAGIGAHYLLVNKDLRKKAMRLLKRIEYIEIATKEEFQRAFAESMYFPYYKTEEFPSLKEYRTIPKR